MAENKYTDFSKGSKQAVMDLINASNQTEFTDVQIDIRDVTVRDEERNVSVIAVAKQGSGYSGMVEMLYRRVALNEIPDVEAGLTEYDMEKYSDLLAYFMDMHGVLMVSEDITINGADLDNEDLPVVQEYDQPMQFVVAAKPQSFAWFGSVTLEITRTRVNLADIWTVQVLDGLYAPQNGFPWPNPAIVPIDQNGENRAYEDGTIKLFAVAN